MSVSAAERAHVEEILRGEEPGRFTWWRLLIGGEEFSQFASCEWEASPGVYGLVLRATVRKPIPDALREERVRLDIVIDGIPSVVFTGKIFAIESSGSLIPFQAASSGHFLAGFELGARLVFDAAPPWQAVREALGKGDYEGLVEVEPVDSPKFTRTGSQALSATNSPAELLEQVGSEVPYEFFDTPQDGHEAFLRRAPADFSEPEFTFEVGKNVKKEEFSAEPRESAVAEVVVIRQKAAALPTEDPWEVLARVAVPGSKAPKGTVEKIQTSDYSADGPRNALQTAYDRALELANRHRVSFTGPVHPFLRRGKPIGVIEPGEDRIGRYRRTWLVVLDTYVGALPRKRMAYAGEAIRLSTIYEARPEESPLAGVAGVAHPLVGRNHLNLFYVSPELPWIRVAGDYVYADVDAALASGVEIIEEALTVVRIRY